MPKWQKMFEHVYGRHQGTSIVFVQFCVPITYVHFSRVSWPCLVKVMSRPWSPSLSQSAGGPIEQWELVVSPTLRLQIRRPTQFVHHRKPKLRIKRLRKTETGWNWKTLENSSGVFLRFDHAWAVALPISLCFDRNGRCGLKWDRRPLRWNSQKGHCQSVSQSWMLNYDIARHISYNSTVTFEWICCDVYLQIEYIEDVGI